MLPLDEAKLLATLLGVLKKENSKVKEDLLKELYQELQKEIDDQSGVKYLQLDELEEPVPIQVFKGEQGKEGPRGKQGQKGTKGDTGPQGERGSIGPQGDRGLVGSIGPQGIQGLVGNQGPAGKDGKDGLDGHTPDVKPIEDRLSRLFDEFKGSVSAQVTRMAYAKGPGGLGGSSSGSGEVRLLRLDDVDDTNLADGKALRYNASLGKFELVAPFNPEATGHLIPSANNVYDLGSQGNQWRDLYLSGSSLFINGVPAMQQDANTGNILLATNTVVSVANGAILPVAASSIDKETGLVLPQATVADLDGYLQVANANILLDGKANAVDLSQYLQVANAISSNVSGVTSYDQLTGKPNLDQYLQVANVSSINADYNNLNNTPNLDIYAANSALALKADTADLSQYLQVANSFNQSYNDLTDKPNLAVYASNTYVNTQLSNKADVSALNDYLQVANNFSGVYGDLTSKPDLDIYATNTDLNLKADSIDLTQYLQVANASSISVDYNNLTNAPNLDIYASNNALALKADSAALSDYIQVANVSALVTQSIDNLVDSAPAALDTLNELAAALGDDNNFASTVTTNLASKASNTYVNTQLGTKANATDLNNYLLVANSFSESYNDLTDRPNLDIYASNNHVNTQLSNKADRSELTEYLQAANNFSGVYSDLTGKPNLDIYASNTALALKANSTDLNQYVQVANVSVLITDGLNSLVDGAPAALDTLNELAAALGDDGDFATTITTSLAAKSSNTYVNTELATKASNTYVNTELANKTSYTYVDTQLNAKASNAYVNTQLNIKASNAYVNVQLDTKASNTYVNTQLSNKANASDLDQYLQAANNFSGVYGDLTGKPNLDIYASNTAMSLKADSTDLNQYLQVANTFSESYNDLTDKPNLDLYAANSSVNSALSLKANAADLNQYLQVANVSSLISTQIDNLVDGAPGALDTLNELAASLGDDDNFAGSITTSLATKASNTYVSTQLSNKADVVALNDYLQVANTFSGSYSDLTGRPNLDAYASNTAMSLKADTTALNNYLNVANTANLVSSIQSQGTGQTLIESKINNILTLKTLKAGAGLTIVENNGEITIAATGDLAVEDRLDFGFVDNDFGSITDDAETDSIFDFGTL